MQLRDRVVIVTGGGSGIGAALCRRFAAEGARGIAVADLDGARAEAVAEEVSGLGVACDVSREAEVRDLVARCVERFGPVDLFCANAGLVVGAGLGDGESGPFAPDAAWQKSWEVHVMGPVYAARAVLPAMLERGEGAFLCTASAAGLITDLAAHAYSVTKHATVAFAEWLAIAYGDRGVAFHCLCPMGVRTPLLEGASQAAGGGGHLRSDVLEPEDVAGAVVAGLADGRFLILPHPRAREFYQRRVADTDRWLAGMRRLRARVGGRSRVC